MSSDVSAPDRRIVYGLLGIAAAAVIGWIVAVIVGANVTQDLGTLLAATVGACLGGATTWLSRRGTPATDAPAPPVVTLQPETVAKAAVPAQLTGPSVGVRGRIDPLKLP